ncbi:MAG TPA: hypothetical protein VMJ90_07275 [Anaerolineales bacterium]|nr:hypothetical protein [Anaerolineales bacterium]
MAERLGYTRDESLTLGKAVAGLNAQSKGKRLGIYEEKSEEEKEKEKKREKPARVEFVELLGRGIPCVKTPKGLRAAIKGEEIDPQSVQKYLQQKFGADLEAVRSAMEKLAKAFTPRQLDGNAFGLYEKFRPKIPEGVKGWGAKGELDLNTIVSLAK